MWKRNAIVAVILAIVAFFWIWFFEYLGAEAYWVALITFGVCMAYGPALTRALPWATIGGVVGVLLGAFTFILFMLFLPLYYGLSVAIAGAIFILVAGLISIPKLREMLPMLLVGWGAYLGAMARFDYLLAEKPIEAIPRALTSLVGVILSVLIGLGIAWALNTLVLEPRKARAEVPEVPPAPPATPE